MAGDGDIDTSGSAWGLYANSSRSAFAIRPFTGGSLTNGQVFQVSFDNGTVSNSGEIVVGLLDSFNNPVLRIRLLGGSTMYDYIDAGGAFSTGMGFGDEGFTLTITMTGPTSYSASLDRFDGSNVVWSGTLFAAPEAFGVQNYSAGPNPSDHLFINSMSIVPEPSVLALAAIGILGVAFRHICRRG